MLLDDKVTQDEACHIFRAMHKGEKPYLNPALLSHKAVINTVRKMRETIMITEAHDVYFRDFPISDEMSPEARMRLASFTGVQPPTWHMTRIHKRMGAALKGVSRGFTVVGQDVFDRFLPLEGVLDLRIPTVIGNGGFYEAEALCLAIQQRLENETAAPLLIYNEDGLWDDLLRDRGVSKGTANILIATTPRELREHARHVGTSYTSNILSFKKAAMENPHAFVILPEAHAFNGSGNSKKRSDIVSPFNVNHVDMRFRHANDAVGAFANAEEAQKTAAGNAIQKQFMFNRLYQNNSAHMRIAGSDPDNSFGIVSDIVMSSLQPHIADHPKMERYRHVLVPGQAFPGSEMANVEKVDNMETLFHTLNEVFDDLEAQGIAVDRRIAIQTVLYIFPANQALPENPTQDDIKFLAVSGSQTYHILKEPSYIPEGGHDLDSYLALPDQPITSLGQRQKELGHIHPDTHNARAYEALASVISLPRRDILSNPYVAKPKLQDIAEIVTDRHFLGSWTTPSDHFTKAALAGLEDGGYRFADQWEGPRTFEGIEDFRKGRHAFITMPYDYSNPGDNKAKLEEKILRHLLMYALDVDRELGDPYLRGRPHVVMDRHLMEMREHSFRVGLAGTHPHHGARWVHDDNTSLLAHLDAAWQRHEYCYDPHIPQWEQEPRIPDSLGKEASIALLGSAKSHNAEKIAESARLAEMVIESGYGVRDGFGGEGDMGGFALGVARMAKRRKDVAYFGVTTPLAAIEKRPVVLDDTYLRNNNASVRTMYQRVNAIFRPDVAAGIYRSGGNGTGEEFKPALTNVQGTTDILLAIDASPIRYRDRSMTAFSPVMSVYSAWEKAQAKMVEAVGVDALFAAADAHIKARRTKTQALTA